MHSSESQNRRILIFILIASTFWIYYFSNPAPQFYYDYTFRVAENFLRGAIAFEEKPPAWLNEFVPYDGGWYSVFPLGAVLTMIPFAALKIAGVVGEMPASLIAALTAGATAWFLFLIAERFDLGEKKRILLVSGILFGSWMWTNLAMAGAWQLALGFAVLGELGALYFTVFSRRPLFAGLFFALAFGNRTEVLLTAPILIFLLLRDSERLTPYSKSAAAEVKNRGSKNGNPNLTRRSQIINLAKFCAAPLVLGLATLVYNYLRFHSFTDFGYARIPGVLQEPWYAHGIFSLSYIPLNFREMLVTPWKRLATFPYFVPGGFGGAIWWSSPFLLYLFRRGGHGRILKYAAWAAIFVLTFLLWTHGNPGGWQFGYRYAMILLPWMFIILLETGEKETRWYDWLVFLFSIAINLYATYLFFGTNYIKP